MVVCIRFKAVTRIASSPLKIDLAPLLAGDTLQVLAGFLRKNQRALKLATLLLFDTLVRKKGIRDDSLFCTMLKYVTFPGPQLPPAPESWEPPAGARRVAAPPIRVRPPHRAAHSQPAHVHRPLAARLPGNRD